ncbi:MAG TPA: orotate phosphoribosyltransferase [Candidatus Fimousia stercorigallinarum]|nr:orotate phosphoribosyltransferase [Candidatus Fimousia stercorigallinarum]
MESRKITIRSKRSNLALKVIPGHFATRNSHINYYLDITTIRARQSEAKAAASILVQDYSRDIVIDTIVCLDGTEIIGAFLAEKLSEQGFYTKNYHHSTYIITPEVDQLGQWFFRENMLPMLKNKNILLLMASVTTGITIKQSIECISFYGGNLQGISSVFSTLDQYHGLPIYHIFSKQDIPDYHTYSRHDCPYCQREQPLEALVNAFGYSEIK